MTTVLSANTGKTVAPEHVVASYRSRRADRVTPFAG